MMVLLALFLVALFLTYRKDKASGDNFDMQQAGETRAIIEEKR